MIFLALPYNLLKCIGIFSLHIKSSKWTLLAYDLYRGFIFVLTSMVTVLMTVQLCLVTDLTMLARTIDMWTMFLSGIFKWVFMTIFNEEFAKLKSTLVQIHAQGQVAYGEYAADQFEMEFMKPTRKITWWYLFSGVIATILFSSAPILSYPKGDRSDFEYYNDPKSYPLCCWIPFMLHEKWMFFAIFFSHVLALALVMFMYLGIDSFLFGAIYAVGGQIEMLKLSLNSIENCLTKIEHLSCTDRITRYTQKQDSTCYSILRECVKHHILILTYIQNIRKLFNLLIIVDYLHGITSLSFALFQLTFSTGVGETLGVSVFLVVSTWHQFLNNFFGELILQKQLSVGIALYNVPWWQANKKIRQLLTVMISRTNNPTIITGFYLYKLSYESFLKFVKALYTYYMVLRRVNG